MTDIQEAGGSNPPMHTMKAILEFDLTDKDDREEHLRCVKSLDMALAIGDIVEYARSKAKYSGETAIEIEEVRDEIQNILYRRDIDLDHLLS